MTTLAARLGYAPDAKLVIIHCDDFGMCHAENVATVTALEEGVASSTSIMAPCPWRDEAIAYARSHPDADVGLHCTLTSEWDVYRWGPVSPAADVPSLVDPNGYLWKQEEPFAAHADPHDVERELRAQHALLTSRGVDLTHVDMHMQALVTKPEHFDVYARLAQEWRLPFMFPRLDTGLRQLFDPEYERVSRATEAELTTKGLFVIDRLIMQVGEEPDRGAYYSALMAELDPGLTQIIVHVATDTDEVRTAAITNGEDGYSYRFADYAALLDERWRSAIAAHNVHVIPWRAIRSVLYA